MCWPRLNRSRWRGTGGGWSVCPTMGSPRLVATMFTTSSEAFSGSSLRLASCTGSVTPRTTERTCASCRHMAS
jgi:hypothetical protein